MIKKSLNLDQLLAVAALTVLTKEMHWEYSNCAEKMAERGRPVAGRQIAWIIADATRSTDADAYITSYENLKEMPPEAALQTNLD